MKEVNCKKSPITEDLAFLREHPEYDRLGPQLRGTYRLCQSTKVKGRTGVSLQEAYDHIERCEKCKKTMILKKEMVDHPE